jgi:hypothetical protein
MSYYNHNINIKNNIIQYIQTKDEIEDDIIKINKLLNRKIIILSHLVKRDIGDKYNFISILNNNSIIHNQYLDCVY